MSPFCSSNTPQVPVVFALLPPWLSQGERWLTRPEQRQVASLTDSLICCLLHCCSSPANRGNSIYSCCANVNQTPLLLLLYRRGCFCVSSSCTCLRASICWWIKPACDLPWEQWPAKAKSCEDTLLRNAFWGMRFSLVVLLLTYRADGR